MPDHEGWRHRAEMSLDVPAGLPRYLSGSRSPSHAASDDRIRAFAAALALGIDDYEVDLREHLHERELLFRADPVRFAGECAYITAAMSVFASQQGA